jgi:hypothetical protein
MSTFTYAGRRKVTAVQYADDTTGTLMAMIGTRDGASVELHRERAPLVTVGTDELLTLDRREQEQYVVLTWEGLDTGRRWTMRPGDLLISLDDDPHDYTVMSPAMFGALFRTGE